ncbi:uncharacterized protein THITE_2074975 [Thermothielavioides terrestris NRRL 8126]|uniref:Metallo-beta-lactamase domain-containing protein n=1 Tax=Thermothielavioides terrestris (strain ATCC 38088 / NRRL 8126) TaxID=578455 RepID=G2QWY3_THETT|nr:uncharacterized protein THITE_2074975 [Thermothielavioides terrestris NRRL 8126]AEO63949.1 hypothetical protein THITE_2074975 [Thermothielavioides terrestris NRRL 8126]
MLALSPVTKPKAHDAAESPEHHVLPPSTGQAALGWASYLPSWAPSPGRSRPSLRKEAAAGFRNPWPSWHKPTLTELWENCQWGESNDGCVELAESHLADDPAPQKPEPSRLPRFSDVNDWPNSPGAKAARLLCIEDPDFTFPAGSKAKVTWLGHAAVLVQLPPLESRNSRPVRCLFDPMFSMRASPSQLAGPIRSYPPPCRAEDLPQIDAVFLSHNHFDHIDYDSITAVWRQSKDVVRFFVPLENKKWLLDWGIPADRVVEMDWWDSTQLSVPGTTTSNTLQIHCTPAQHNSWRSGADADASLWSSWYLTYSPHSSSPAHDSPYRLFFAGDTGYQFHPDNPFPACPAFAEIRARLGPPHLLLLPVSVGPTLAYLRSFFVPPPWLLLPAWANPLPRLRPGVTAANHLPPWDAVRVLKVMAGVMGGGQDDGGGSGGGDDYHDERGMQEVIGTVAVAMHWGTFVTDPVEVLATLGELEWACSAQGVRFARRLSAGEGGERGKHRLPGSAGRGEGATPWFLALNHGQSVCL